MDSAAAEYQPIASLTGLPTRLSISTSESMVNLVVFLFTTSDTRGRDTIRISAASACFKWWFSDPGGQLVHQLLFRQARVIDLFAGGRLSRLASLGEKPSSVSATKIQSSPQAITASEDLHGCLLTRVAAWDC